MMVASLSFVLPGYHCSPIGGVALEKALAAARAKESEKKTESPVRRPPVCVTLMPAKAALDVSDSMPGFVCTGIIGFYSHNYVWASQAAQNVDLTPLSNLFKEEPFEFQWLKDHVKLPRVLADLEMVHAAETLFQATKLQDEVDQKFLVWLDQNPAVDGKEIAAYGQRRGLWFRSPAYYKKLMEFGANDEEFQTKFDEAGRPQAWKKVCNFDAPSWDRISKDVMFHINLSRAGVFVPTDGQRSLKATLCALMGRGELLPVEHTLLCPLWGDKWTTLLNEQDWVAMGLEDVGSLTLPAGPCNKDDAKGWLGLQYAVILYVMRTGMSAEDLLAALHKGFNYGSSIREWITYRLDKLVDLPWVEKSDDAHDQYVDALGLTVKDKDVAKRRRTQ